MMSSTTVPLRDMFDASGRGIQHNGLRRANERAVLSVVGFNPGVSNADISRLSGLAPQTVSAILSDIDQSGLITRGEVLRGRRGQPATPIFLRADGAFSIGVEIGRRHVDVLLINLHAEVLAHEHRSYASLDPCRVLADIAEMAAALGGTLSAQSKMRLHELAVALPSNLSESAEMVGSPLAQLDIWDKAEIKSELAKLTGLNVSIYNDGNAACWAELIALPKPRPNSFIYFLITRDLAAGIAGEGLLWAGATGNAANLGSMLVTSRDGQLQPAHAIVSTKALADRLNSAGHGEVSNDAGQWDWTSFGPVLDQWVDVCAVALAKVVFNTTQVMEAEAVVLDGILPPWVIERLVGQLEIELAALPVANYSPPQIAAGNLGALAPAIGAAELTLYRRYFSRSLSDLAG